MKGKEQIRRQRRCVFMLSLLCPWSICWRCPGIRVLVDLKFQIEMRVRDIEFSQVLWSCQWPWERVGMHKGSGQTEREQKKDHQFDRIPWSQTESRWLCSNNKLQKCKHKISVFASFPLGLPTLFSLISYSWDTRTIAPGSSGTIFQNFVTREENPPPVPIPGKACDWPLLSSHPISEVPWFMVPIRNILGKGRRIFWKENRGKYIRQPESISISFRHQEIKVRGKSPGRRLRGTPE